MKASPAVLVRILVGLVLAVALTMALVRRAPRPLEIQEDAADSGALATHGSLGDFATTPNRSQNLHSRESVPLNGSLSPSLIADILSLQESSDAAEQWKKLEKLAADVSEEELPMAFALLLSNPSSTSDFGLRLIRFRPMTMKARSLD
ncbi:MAG: hypothetical protein EXS36_06750 [Pedosphaera sp.]|nr:hypothetical protein [Pedosphaera sp.]